MVRRYFFNSLLAHRGTPVSSTTNNEDIVLEVEDTVAVKQIGMIASLYRKLDPELHREVQDYLAEMNADKAERDDVWYWVHHGVDIYDNPWFYYNDAGWPADLITAIRMDKDRREEHEVMSEEERLELSRDYSEEARAFERSLWELDAIPRQADLVLNDHLT